MRDGLKVSIKEFQDPPQFLVGRLSAKLRIASKLQSKYMEASGNNKYIIRVLGYGHECKWGNDSLETHIFLVEEYYPNGNMDTIICGIFQSFLCTNNVPHYESKQQFHALNLYTDDLQGRIDFIGPPASG